MYEGANAEFRLRSLEKEDFNPATSSFTLPFDFGIRNATFTTAISYTSNGYPTHLRPMFVRLRWVMERSASRQGELSVFVSPLLPIEARFVHLYSSHPQFNSLPARFLYPLFHLLAARNPVLMNVFVFFI